MSDGIYSAASGAIARQAQLDTVSHNLANTDTAGFRGTRVGFEEILVARESGVAQVAPSRIAIDATPGIVEATENPYDLAIAGDGFFQVNIGGETALTRNGQLHLNPEGQLVTTSGLAILNRNGQPITPPPGGEFFIDERGTIFDDFGVVDQIAVVSVDNPEGLEPIGPATWRVTEGEVKPSEAWVQQGYLEKSNVDPVTGMTDLIKLQRHFEAMQQLIQTFSQVDQRAAKSLGNLG